MFYNNWEQTKCLLQSGSSAVVALRWYLGACHSLHTLWFATGEPSMGFYLVLVSQPSCTAGENSHFFLSFFFFFWFTWKQKTLVFIFVLQPISQNRYLLLVTIGVLQCSCHRKLRLTYYFSSLGVYYPQPNPPPLNTDAVPALFARLGSPMR